MVIKTKNKIFDLYLELFCGKNFFIHKLNDSKLQLKKIKPSQKFQSQQINPMIEGFFF